ncbi:MAG: hypothetical protein WC346_19095 [Methanogenium sp.]
MSNLNVHRNIMGYAEIKNTDWDKIVNLLFNLKEIKISSLENIQVALKDYDKFLPEKAELSKLKDILLSLDNII